MIALPQPATLLAPLALSALLALLALAPWSDAIAQKATPAAARAADPADPAASVPPARHRSALVGYRRLVEPEPLAWREANDNVGRIGGWRAYAREAAAAAGASPAATPASGASTSTEPKR